MASVYPPRHYDDATLKALEHVFSDVWKTLQAEGVPPQTEEMLRAKVAQTLLYLADQGMSDPNDLRAEIMSRLRS